MPSASLSEAQVVAQEVGLAVESVSAAIQLLDEGNTLPFITRYRKAVTQGLDEPEIQAIRASVDRYRTVADRRRTILKTVAAQGKLTPQRRQAIESADSLKKLEDLYLPFKPKRQSLATVARQRGLEPFCAAVLEQAWSEAEFFEHLEGWVAEQEAQDSSLEDAIQGICYLLAEHYHEHAPLRDWVRQQLWNSACLRTSAWGSQRRDEATQTKTVRPTSGSESGSARTEARGQALAPSNRKPGEQRQRRKEQNRYADYFDFSEPLHRLPPHRILAINRGERAKVLRVRLVFDLEHLVAKAQERLVPLEHPQGELLQQSLRDALQRLLIPSLEREIRRELTDEAETHAVQVFAQNLRHLLLQPPVHGHRILAIDPGFKRGCQVAVLDSWGTLLNHGVVFVIGNEERRERSRQWLLETLTANQVSVIAIGNGAACRDAEELVAELLAGPLAHQALAYVIVNEAGASIYSTSELGREELPQLDPTLRSAVSIGRRLLDPISELVKISPEHLGVGMYQHDVKARQLRDSLDEVVASCVNYVGVDANRASPALLKYVSGLNQLSARRFCEYREQHGPFASRDEFRLVPGFGEATFIQAAGFLKIDNPANPLDATWIHPESYPLAERLLMGLGATLADLRAMMKGSQSSRAIGDVELSRSFEDAGHGQTLPGPPSEGPDKPPGVDSLAETASNTTLAMRLRQIDPQRLAEELETNEWLIGDLVDMLQRPGRDPRESLPPPLFRTGVNRLEDLEVGMSLMGKILNVVDFGVFVDVGLSESGLVHISRLSHDYLRDPHERFAVGQVLQVWVVGVDKQRRRVSLSAIDPLSSSPDAQDGQPGHQTGALRRHDSAEDGEKRRARRRWHRANSQTATGGSGRANSPPLTPEITDGKSPMRSFGELLRYYEHKQDP